MSFLVRWGGRRMSTASSYFISGPKNSEQWQSMYMRGDEAGEDQVPGEGSTEIKSGNSLGCDVQLDAVLNTVFVSATPYVNLSQNYTNWVNWLKNESDPIEIYKKLLEKADTTTFEILPILEPLSRSSERLIREGVIRVLNEHLKSYKSPKVVALLDRAATSDPSAVNRQLAQSYFEKIK